MSHSRLAQLQEFLDENPDDPFNHYALGLEVAKSDSQEALNIFKSVLNRFPEYLPTYYQAALLMINMELLLDAKYTIDQGINLASRTGETKTLNELKGLLDDLDD